MTGTPLGGQGKGTWATAQGKLHALERPHVYKGVDRPYGAFWHNKYSVGHHEYSAGQRLQG